MSYWEVSFQFFWDCHLKKTVGKSEASKHYNFSDLTLFLSIWHSILRLNVISKYLLVFRKSSEHFKINIQNNFEFIDIDSINIRYKLLIRSH